MGTNPVAPPDLSLVWFALLSASLSKQQGDN